MINKFFSLILLCFLLSACTRINAVDFVSIEERSTHEQHFSAPTFSREIQDYVGLIVPPYPDNLHAVAGMVLPDSSGQWALFVVKNNETFMLWLIKLDHRDNEGNPFWMVTNGLILPPLAEFQVIIPFQCRIWGEFDYDLVVLATLEPENANSRYIDESHIQFAWTVNRDTGTLESIDNEGIDCYAETVLFP